MLNFSLCIFLLGISTFGFSSEGLIIHASEIGVGKFHRLDNEKNPYGMSAWRVFILPNEASAKTPLLTNNDDGSKTIFFSTLEELLKTVVQISNDEGKQVDLLTLHGHGIPGAMWFPKNDLFKKSVECYRWKDMANAPDETSYQLYYSGLKKESALQMRKQAQEPLSPNFQCMSGLRAWKDMLAQIPEFKKALAPHSQIHFMACVVGLGLAGDNFLSGLAHELYDDKKGLIQAPVKLGLGDWSMPEGMGFWDYLTDAQQAHDSANYPIERRDRSVMQRGDIKVAQVLIPGEVKLGFIKDEEFMLLEKDERPVQWSDEFLFTSF